MFLDLHVSSVFVKIFYDICKLFHEFSTVLSLITRYCIKSIFSKSIFYLKFYLKFKIVGVLTEF